MFKLALILLFIFVALFIALWSPLPEPAIKVCNDETKNSNELQGLYHLSRVDNADNFFKKSLQLSPSYSFLLKQLALLTHKQRIEQCGNRFAVSFNFARLWAVHKFIADGSMRHGIDDMTAMGDPMAASASYEDKQLTITSYRQEGVFISTTRKLNNRLITKVTKQGKQDIALTLHFKKVD